MSKEEMIDIYNYLVVLNKCTIAFDFLVKNQRTDLIRWKNHLIKEASERNCINIVEILIQDESIYFKNIYESIYVALHKNNYRVVKILTPRIDIRDITYPNFINVVNIFIKEISKDAKPYLQPILVLNEFLWPDITMIITYFILQFSKWKQIINYHRYV